MATGLGSLPLLGYFARLLSRGGKLARVQRLLYPLLLLLNRPGGSVLSTTRLLIGGAEVGLTEGVLPSQLVLGGFGVCVGTLASPGPATSVVGQFEQVASRLALSYFVQHQALDRKLRKIVKNRYRYVRRYVYVRPSERTRRGLRLLVPTRHLYPSFL